MADIINKTYKCTNCYIHKEVNKFKRNGKIYIVALRGINTICNDCNNNPDNYIKEAVKYIKNNSLQDYILKYANIIYDELEYMHTNYSDELMNDYDWDFGSIKILLKVLINYQESIRILYKKLIKINKLKINIIDKYLNEHMDSILSYMRFTYESLIKYDKHHNSEHVQWTYHQLHNVINEFKDDVKKFITELKE